MKNITKLAPFFIAISLNAQSPWTQEKGKLYTQIAFSTIANYNTLFGDPEYTIPGNITDNTLQLYSEIGLSSKTSLIINVPVKLITVNNFQDPRINCVGNCEKDFSKNALGNIQIGIKQNFYNKGWLISGQLSVEANTSTYDSSSGIRTGIDAFTITPLFLIGKGFTNSYLQGFSGIDIRTNNYSTNFRIGGEYGYKIFKPLWLIGFVDVVKSFNDGSIALPQENLFTGLYVNNQEYGAFGLKTIAEFNQKSGFTAAFGGAFFGNNVPKQTALSFGLYHKF